MAATSTPGAYRYRPLAEVIGRAGAVMVEEFVDRIVARADVPVHRRGDVAAALEVGACHDPEPWLAVHFDGMSWWEAWDGTLNGVRSIFDWLLPLLAGEIKEERGRTGSHRWDH